MIDLSTISLKREGEIINPTAIFASLPNKSSKYNGYLRSVQAEVLEQWFNLRDEKNNIIKMNTGSGKTTISLLILQSCLNEKKGNAIYVVPNSYLLNQVKDEAKDLGIKVVDDVNNLDFKKNNAILLITIQKLINGKSIFDARNQIDNILIDDVHACLDATEQQALIKIERDTFPKLYDAIFNLYKKDLEKQNKSNCLNIQSKDPVTKPMLVPFWSVRENTDYLTQYLNDYKDKIQFQLSFLDDILKFCNVMISYNCIEISPDFIPIYKITSFDRAKRRIFVSATLKDDGRLLNSFDIKSNEISSIITPKESLDIGNRMILFPQAINSNITDNEIKEYLKNISQKYRVVVIVPSLYRSNYWQDVADHIFTKDNISEIKNYEKGLDVLVNRYDGIDLKDNLCSYLVIDGVPNSSTLFEQYKEIVMGNNFETIMLKMQKIEQGMGRGIRSNLDNCAVIIMDKKLLNVIYNHKAIESFSPSTKAQYELSEDLTKQIQNQENATLKEIVGNFSYCLNRDEEWIKLENERLNQVHPIKNVQYDQRFIDMRFAFSAAANGNLSSCIDVLQNLAAKEEDITFKGILLFYLAKYMDFKDNMRAQKILIKAKEFNKGLIIPIEGADIKFKKNLMLNQSYNVLKIIQEDYGNDVKKYLYEIQSVISNLSFGVDTYKRFEKSIYDIARLIGFEAGRPEFESGVGPDDFWGLGNNKYLIIECKSEAVTNFISKDYSGQLCTSVNWGKTEFGKEATIVPVLIHPSSVFDKAAMPNEDFKIMTADELKKLCDNVSQFAMKMSVSELNEKIISDILVESELTTNDIITKYLSGYTIAK